MWRTSARRCVPAPIAARVCPNSERLWLMNRPMDVSRKPLESQCGRMERLSRLPVFLALEGKRCVLVGEGQAVDWKLELLEAAGAQVQRYAVHGWTAEDLRGAAIAVGGFDDDEQARLFSDAARAVGVPVNVIDRPAFCDFSFGAIRS